MRDLASHLIFTRLSLSFKLGNIRANRQTKLASGIRRLLNRGSPSKFLSHPSCNQGHNLVLHSSLLKISKEARPQAKQAACLGNYLRPLFKYLLINSRLYQLNNNNRDWFPCHHFMKELLVVALRPLTFYNKRSHQASSLPNLYPLTKEPPLQYKIPL